MQFVRLAQAVLFPMRRANVTKFNPTGLLLYRRTLHFGSDFNDAAQIRETTYVCI